jgi:hypothetical protein
MKRTKIKTSSVSDEQLIKDYLEADGNITYCEPGTESENIVYTAGTRRKKDYSKEENK